MKTVRRGKGLALDQWEQLKRQRKIGGVWVELDEHGHADCRDTVGKGDAVSSSLLSKVINILSHLDNTNLEALDVAIRKLDRVALLARKQKKESDNADIGEVLLKLVEMQGELPGEGIACRTAMLIQGPRESVEDWFGHTISSVELWLSPRDDSGAVDSVNKSAQPVSVKEHRSKKPQELSSPEVEPIDLERVFFSQGPEVAEARLMYLAAEMAVKFPDRKETLKNRVVEAIESGKAPVVEPPRAKKPRESKPEADPSPPEKPVQPAKEVKLPPRTGHPLIEKLASLWDQREKLTRPQFVQQFQYQLREFYRISNLKDYNFNKYACQWINTIARTERIKMILDKNDGTSVAVTILCVNQSQFGYFVPRTAERTPQKVKGHLAPEFPRLRTVPL